MRTQGTVFACKGPLGRAQWLHCPPTWGPELSRRACWPLESSLHTGTGRHPVPTAQPSPAWAPQGSAVEQSSGCLQSGPQHTRPSVAPRAQPHALLPSCCGIWGTGETEALSACLRRLLLPPSGLSLGGLVLQGIEPRSEIHPSPVPDQGVRGGGPSPTCMHHCQERLCGQETQP